MWLKCDMIYGIWYIYDQVKYRTIPGDIRDISAYIRWNMWCSYPICRIYDTSKYDIAWRLLSWRCTSKYLTFFGRMFCADHVLTYVLHIIRARVECAIGAHQQGPAVLLSVMDGAVAAVRIGLDLARVSLDEWTAGGSYCCSGRWLSLSKGGVHFLDVSERCTYLPVESNSYCPCLLSLSFRFIWISCSFSYFCLLFVRFGVVTVVVDGRGIISWWPIGWEGSLNGRQQRLIELYHRVHINVPGTWCTGTSIGCA